ncbi:hypothetical protein JK636_19165 [Clostridium sp. YIM B02515]|uniref:ATPase BadF/BadG/BcrA/BcrD type domain-containing protein n=1 Tax=Clostridium rhizosphaerae TaxID=2803861 RepID=A0ABS1TEM5_9CLOT|nr:BadF/BadG/BcrA/BcrD ATPase family protein [Clostridium rhizosphaerae]MBL4937831.1 hypothetical protein [Clostridium rhizosphaerae]
MKYYLGVDGGGTKTDYILINEKFLVIDRLQGGTTNHEALQNGYDGTYYELYEHIHKLLSRNNLQIGDVKDAVFGLAGIDFCFQHDVISKSIVKIGLSKFLLCNDGFLGVKAMGLSGKQSGINYNSGTATCCAGIDDSGNMLQLGGIGELSGDFGGGLTITQSVYMLIYRELFLKKAKTILTKYYFDEFKITNREEFLESARFFSESYIPDFRKKLVEIFFIALNEGDAECNKIAHKMASKGAVYISAMLENLRFEGNVNIILSGSIHSKADSARYIDLLTKELENKHGSIFNFHILETEPVDGTRNWIEERNS